METNRNAEQYLLVLVLRTLGKSHDEVRSMIECAKEKVGKAERWIKSLPLDEAVKFCDNEAVKRLVMRKFPGMDETSPADLVRAGQLTGEDILRHYRPDYMYPRVGFEEKQKFLELLDRWRQQLDFPSIGSFLNESRLRNLDDRLESEIVETLEFEQSHIRASARHWRTISKSLKPVLAVENEPLFKQLQSRFPNLKAWPAQESWDKALLNYLEAFMSSVVEIEISAEMDISSRLKGFPGEPVDVNVSETRELLQELKESKPALWKNLQLLKIVLVCDVFMLGINEQPTAAFWAVDLENLRKIRSAVDRRRMALSTDYDPWASRRAVDNMARYLRSHDDIRDKVSALLGAFAALKAVQGSVYLSLDALERDISGSAGFSEPAGDAT
jgi:hypothetical protein